MIVKIEDDFSPEKIMCSGQCFRAHKLSDGSFFFITGRKCINIRVISSDQFEVSCNKSDWERTWIKYFDLNKSYKDIRHNAQGINSFIDEAMEYGKGIRILRQDPWEMLISFIISQRKSIPAIAKSIEFIATNFGSHLFLGDKVINSFPTYIEMKNLIADDLSSCGLGYRLPYIINAIKRVNEDGYDLGALSKLSDEALISELKSFLGVGNKVANCVALFAYARTSLAPVDVWIQKVIDNHFAGENLFPKYGEVAGIMQQYAFFYERSSHNLRN